MQNFSAPEEKVQFLKSLFQETYISDIVGRHKIRSRAGLEEPLNILSSAIGSLTNPTKLSARFQSEKKKNISSATIARYLDYLCDAYLVDKALRYDSKRKKYIDTPVKYYFTDMGLRNARLNFRQMEIDFVCNMGFKRYYIQSAYALPEQAKLEQEQRSLTLTGDFFKKIIITKDTPAPYYNDIGVLIVNVYDFLLNENSLEL